MAQNSCCNQADVEDLGASLAEAIVCVRETNSDERLLELCGRWEGQLRALAAVKAIAEPRYCQGR